MNRRKTVPGESYPLNHPKEGMIRCRGHFAYFSRRIRADRPCASNPSIALKVSITGVERSRDFLFISTQLVRR